jgi:hypothetical protein
VISSSHCLSSVLTRTHTVCAIQPDSHAAAAL